MMYAPSAGLVCHREFSGSRMDLAAPATLSVVDAPGHLPAQRGVRGVDGALVGATPWIPATLIT